MYDVCYIVNNYYDELSYEAKENAYTAIYEKGLDQFDYLVETQKDDLPDISEEDLLTSFLTTCEKLGVITDEIKQEVNLDEIDVGNDAEQDMER